MDGDNKRTRANASSSGDVGRAEERRNLLNLPTGPLANVAERLVTSNPRDTARNLGTFKSLEKQALRAARDAAPGKKLSSRRLKGATISSDDQRSSWSTS